MNPFYFLIPAAYFLGAVPFAMIIARAHGKDLRATGSGNIGATNLARAVGKKWGYICFFLDVCKGLLPMLAARFFIEEITPIKLWLWVTVGCSAVLGHVYPVYLKFRGGKGVATSLGMVLGLFPYYTITGGAAFVLWAVLVLAFGYISLGSIAAAGFFPIALIIEILMINKSDWTFATLYPLIAVAVLMGLFVIFKHRSNIKRLMAGTENKVLRKNK